MADSATGRSPTDHQLIPLCPEHLIRLTVHFARHKFHFVAQFTVFLAATENVDAFDNCLLFNQWLRNALFMRPTLRSLTYGTTEAASGALVENSDALRLRDHMIRHLAPIAPIHLPPVVLEVKA